jgi:type III restriction enzyme
MPIHEKFPKSPYEIADPDFRWVPDENLLREKKYDELIPPLVRLIRKDVKKWRDNNYDCATETSKALLNYWFNKKHEGFKYYFAQQESVETVIYLHEIAEIKDKFDLLRYDSSKAISSGMFEEDWVRFVIKMATGSGKTKVLSLIIALSFF